jgi:hypothetical protein
MNKGRKKKQEPEIVEEVIQEKKQSKRGRKVKVVEFKKIDISPLNNFTLEETIILHLPVTLNEILSDNINTKQGIENILTQQPIVPIPYNSVGYTISNNNVQENKKQTPIKSKEKYNDNISTAVDNMGNKMTTKVYSRPLLPTDFTDKDLRVSAQKTDIACWWCCHQFDTYPVGAPVKYDEKKDIFKVVGCFCSFNCAKSFSMYEDRKRCISHNAFLYKKIVGKLEYVKPAPPRTVLQMFGGPISIEEYRSTFNTLSTININVFPMVFSPTQIVYNKIDDSFKIHRNSVNKTALDRRSIDIANNRISNKKSPVIKNNLLNIMGIQVKND